mmetsp:Transcript_36355/g.55820  ORF Transcript_36355/g.55820 Transcript_36355/m.55820 type:complete len:86 (-) Transcript_36355:875-1132(-)|eukprot:CAMPEP_0170487958 /NCGR_PEP_ID=MMETSP0208-20121228/6636_1 /TAXON_ID=197538 /ORGANISM="Strombidium inclinatum, Strain S3" /LENGTH=85 /DNA_ID=CAMNT_0010762389 /DNA_START=1488 /DNA_END=1745 /DNA_ORIENTATION=+
MKEVHQKQKKDIQPPESESPKTATNKQDGKKNLKSYLNDLKSKKEELLIKAKEGEDAYLRVKQEEEQMKKDEADRIKREEEERLQ